MGMENIFCQMVLIEWVIGKMVKGLDGMMRVTQLLPLRNDYRNKN
jgi:hypothetical protein